MRITSRGFSIAFFVSAICVGYWLQNPAPVHAQNPDITLTQSYCNSSSEPCVLTSHNDNSRDGVNPNEITLTASTVAGGLSVLKSVTTDGLIYAQPLYIHGLGAIGSCSGTNVVFVATENDTVYAFDDSTSMTACWSLSLLASGEIAVPYTDTAADLSSGGCTNVVPEVGITGTPVIDVNVTPPVLYVVAKSLDSSGKLHERLHAVSTVMGNDMASIELGNCTLGGGPPPPTCGGSLGANFNPEFQLQRPGLALYYKGLSASIATSDIYISWGSFCDGNTYAGGGANSTNPYNGWVAEVQAAYVASSTFPTLSFVNDFTTEPTPSSADNEGAIWMAGAAPAVDGSGNVYVASANAAVDSTGGGYGWNGGGEWAQSLLQLSNVSGSFGVTDFYTPNDWPELNGGQGTMAQEDVCVTQPKSPTCTYATIVSDTDLGSGGVVLLSASGLTNPEIMGAGKEGMIYTTWYNPSISLQPNGFNDFMGGLDGCGYGSGCTLYSEGSSPSSTDCSEGSGYGVGLITQCFEGFTFPGDSENYGSWGTPAFLAAGSGNNYAYTWGSNDYLKAFLFSVNMSGVGTFDLTPFPASNLLEWGRPGATPSVTWDGSTFSKTVVWAIDTVGWGKIGTGGEASQAQVYAYSGDPSYTGSGLGGPCSVNKLCALWCDGPSANCTTASAPGAVKFVVPTIVDGKVFIAGGNNNPLYWPGMNYLDILTGLTTYCSAPTSPTNYPTNCGMLVIYKPKE